MAGLTLAPQSGGQLAAIAQVRWHVFTHSLRTTKGALELFSRIVISLVIMGGGLGGAVLLGLGAWYFVTEGRPEGLALLLWPVFLFWQFFPVMASALTETMDSSELLRFPLNYRSYVVVRLVYGALDPATVLGSLWLTGITLGIGWARPGLLPWAAVVLLVFAAVNMLLTQMVFAWVERWLAQRRTREIFAVLFFLAMISLQLIGPMLNRYGDRSNATFQRVGRVANPVQGVLPPGLAAKAIASAAGGHTWEGLAWLGSVGLYGAGFLRVLSVRLRAQYRGENLSEVSRAGAKDKSNAGMRRGWEVPGLPGPVTAVLEKEFRYLARSGPVLLTFVTPIIMLVVFGMRGRSGSGGGFLQHWPELALPVGAGYALLLLTNLIYNNFGADGGGIQLFLASPASFRSVVMGKNLAHMGVLAAEVVVLGFGVSVLFRPPSLLAVGTTLGGLLFAAPINLAAGNLLSLYSPKKIEFGTFGRQRASQMTVLASFVIQIAVFGLGGLTIFAARYYGRAWLAVVAFLGLAVVAFAVYVFVLGRVDRLALGRREVLTTELCK
jgi:ABC-2 type transport system permease protein